MDPQESVRETILTSRPSPRGISHMTWIDDEVVYWPEGRSAAAIDRLTGALLPFLDGATLVSELIEDVAAAVDADVVDIEDSVVKRLEALARSGLVDGVGPEPIGLVRTEEALPDGTVLRTVSVTLEEGDAEQADKMQSVLSGELSVAEVIPAKSCLGQKLRSNQPADLLGLAVADRIVTVRSNHAATSAALRDLAQVVEPEGPTMAFVAAPFEGDGPPRVYDRFGARTGRPRTGRDAAEVVGHLLRELTAPNVAHSLVLAGTPIVKNGRCVVAGPALRDSSRLRSIVEANAAEVVPTSRVTIGDDLRSVFVDAPFDTEPRRLEVVGFAMIDGDPTLSPLTQTMVTLLSNALVAGDTERQEALNTVRELVLSVPVSCSAPGPGVFGDLATSAMQLLG